MKTQLSTETQKLVKSNIFERAQTIKEQTFPHRNNKKI